MAGLYIHVPFCIRKCPYCDFYSTEYSADTAGEYVSAVIRNIKAYRERFGRIDIETVYFGGGTPSVLLPECLEEILSAACENFFIADNAEISTEANPCTINNSKLKRLKSAGFNRISIGIQSMNDSELKSLGRLHDGKAARCAVEDAYNAGFVNISADLMLGIIGQTPQSLSESIAALSDMPLSHISAYMLKIEEGTAYDCDEIYKAIPDEDSVADLYLQAVGELSANGFLQYEISNFAKQGFECRHNLKYWQCEEYIGIGPAAHSYFNGKRYGVPRSLSGFLASDRQKEIVTEENPGDFTEYAMLNFRLNKGFNLAECTKKFGIDVMEILRKVKPFEKAGLVKVRDMALCLTPKGCLLSNRIILELFCNCEHT